MHTALIAAAAAGLDHMLGEPQRAHPLAGFGRMASAVEARLRRANAPWRQRLAGAIAVALLLAPAALLSGLAARIPVVGAVAEAVLLYFTLGGRSLAEHARRVADSLHANDLEAARRHVGLLVSRDTAPMQGNDVARATAESVLENGNDGVFGALFCFAVAGAPGAVLYRLANTLDAMWGYRNERYLHFGWAAARLDDALNYFPARLTALTYALLGKTRQALGCWREQAPKWDSPNAGPVMAAGAGALAVEIGGPARYEGEWHERPRLGRGAAPVADDIERALRLVRYGVLLWLCALFVIGILTHA